MRSDLFSATARAHERTSDGIREILHRQTLRTRHLRRLVSERNWVTHASKRGFCTTATDNNDGTEIQDPPEHTLRDLNRVYLVNEKGAVAVALGPTEVVRRSEILSALVDEVESLVRAKMTLQTTWDASSFPNA